jgi:N-acetylglucosaminyldiphosphoundecaprenol N-acetyl-beta-D-mannosaminyltransferase
MEILDALTEDDKARTVGFINAHCVNVARNDPDYRRIINDFDEVLPDGAGLDIAARFKGIKIKENLNGTDFSFHVFELFAKRKKAVFLLGGHPGVAERAGKVLSKAHQGLIVCGWTHGYDTDKRDAEICETIWGASPDVILVSMGTPIQEKWIEAHKNFFGKKLFVSVGGLLDFIAGVYPRAPLWLRKIKMEWFFRLCFNPKQLWKRYLIGNQVFLFHALQEALEEKKEHKRTNSAGAPE